ncbi:hypothetical protein D3C86_1476220 [compost metagenome]
MVEEDAIGSMHAVRFAVVDHDPIGVELGDSVGTAGVKGCRFPLRDLLHHAVKFGGRGLVEAGLLFKAEDSDGLEEAQSAKSIGVGRVLGRLKGDLDVALSGQVVDLVGLDLLDDADQVGGIRQVSVVQVKAAVGVMGILVEVVDAIGVE